MSVTQEMTKTTSGETMAAQHSPAPGLRIALVTAYPPSTTTLNEYGYHLARHLAAKPEVGELVILHDEAPEPVTDIPAGARAVPAWRYGCLLNAVRICRAVRASRADVVLVNAHFTSFAAGKAAAALGLMTPALLRAGGMPVTVLLHNLVDTVDLEKAGFSSNPILTRVLAFIGGLVTRIVLGADKVCVTIPQYVDVLRDKYGARNVYLAPHGSFEEPDPVERDPHATPTLLAFGKWGTYKRIEVLLDAHAILRAEGVDVDVVVAGTDSHNSVGYLDGVKQTYGDLPGVHFTGYVAEEDIPRVFGSATVAVFPYTSTTGSSGVLHQAGSYGCPVVLPDIGDLAEVVRDEGFEAVTFDPEDAADLARALRTLLADPAAMASMGRANWAAACGIPLADVADWHLAHLQEICR
ncbi:MAG: glycosyltransferase [Mycobacterium sp.]|nr:MAG: glycosyltransferase [Mycobacterium sp.]